MQNFTFKLIYSSNYQDYYNYCLSPQDMVYKIVAICGSLSKASSNSGLIRACMLVNNPGIQIEVLDVSGFPLFNMDPVIENGFPEPVRAFRQKISHANAVLFATPEHNGKVSAVLKNAYDWASFTPDAEIPPPIKEKPAALIVCCEYGGEKTFQNFKRICGFCKVKLMDRALLVTKVAVDFDPNGNLLNNKIIHQVEEFIHSFVQFLKENKA